MNIDSGAREEDSRRAAGDAHGGSTSSTGERRRFPRAAFPAQLLLSWRDHDLKPVTCSVLNASLTGFRLVSEKRVSVGAVCHAWCILPEETRVNLDMTVVWVLAKWNHCYEFGVRYTDG
jgi:hypothetical protein